jgi:imidazolonepropionase-like amidohydrolase
VTSAAAYSIQQDHRIGYVRAGYDADLAIWDSHPLTVGASAVQVFVDGKEVLDSRNYTKQPNTEVQLSDVTAPKQRAVASKEQKQIICNKALSPNAQLIFTGIKHVLLDTPKLPTGAAANEDFTLVIADGSIACFDIKSICRPSHGVEVPLTIPLKNGYITPGLVAFGNNLGILDISSEPSTGDGSPGRGHNALKEKSSLHFAKYGVHFGGRNFGRARIGGVTRAVTAPIFGGGLLQGVSVGLRTSENATVLGGGIWKDEVALHFHVGQEAKGTFLLN